MLCVCVCVCVFWFVLRAGFSLCYLHSSVHVMCSLWAVSFAICSHEPRRFAPSMPRFARWGRVNQGPQGKGAYWAQWKGPTRAQAQTLRPSTPPSTSNQNLSHVMHIPHTNEFVDPPFPNSAIDDNCPRSQ